jgi:hypothetical protein
VERTVVVDRCVAGCVLAGGLLVGCVRAELVLVLR